MSSCRRHRTAAVPQTRSGTSSLRSSTRSDAGCTTSRSAGPGRANARSGSSSTATAASTSTPITDATHAISPALDDADRRSTGPFLLEVSSPGLERPLRRPSTTRPRSARRSRSATTPTPAPSACAASSSTPAPTPASSRSTARAIEHRVRRDHARRTPCSSGAPSRAHRHAKDDEEAHAAREGAAHEKP